MNDALHLLCFRARVLAKAARWQSSFQVLTDLDDWCIPAALFPNIQSTICSSCFCSIVFENLPLKGALKDYVSHDLSGTAETHINIDKKDRELPWGSAWNCQSTSSAYILVQTTPEGSSLWKRAPEHNKTDIDDKSAMVRQRLSMTSIDGTSRPSEALGLNMLLESLNLYMAATLSSLVTNNITMQQWHHTADKCTHTMYTSFVDETTCFATDQHQSITTSACALEGH